VLKRLCFIALLFSGALSFAQAPTATIVPPPGTLCTGQALIFNSLTTNTPTAYSWTVSPANGVSYAFGSTQPSVGITFTNAGVYSVSLTVSNASGTVTAVNSVSIGISPNALFSASLTGVGFPNQINLTNFSSNANAYQWQFSETAVTDTNRNTTHTYTLSGAYTVSLVAMNNNGCSTVSTYSFYLADSSGITLPNIFTPNGDDVNDVFKPIARGISAIKVSVYTRFGNFVYGWETINGFWDGHTTSGMPCEPGTYFYVLEATGFDGKTYKLKSYLTLLRN
jgi:gliding motility-associated-like protein